MKLLLILMLLPMLSFSQNIADTTIYFKSVRVDTIYHQDTVEATLFIKGAPVYQADGGVSTIQGHVVIIYGWVKNKSFAMEFIPSKVLCYLTEKKRLINSGKVWDYKLRDK